MIEPVAAQLRYEVSFDVTKTGQRDGADVAQLYVAEDKPTVARSPEELKGFARVDLKAGETRHLTLPLDARSFAWYDTAKAAWHVHAGAFTVRIGRSSVDIALEGKIAVAAPAILPVK